MMPNATPATKESQAEACLEVAERYQPQLLALAVKLAGSREAGMDLFQESVLNCHDAIQRNGFVGERYEFYLRVAIKHQYYRAKKDSARYVPFPASFASDGEDEDGTFELSAPAPTLDAHAQLAEQVAAEVRATCTPGERIALRLHADGYSYQDIADLVGLPDRFRVRRLLDRIKAGLRETFRQAWEGAAE